MQDDEAGAGRAGQVIDGGAVGLLQAGGVDNDGEAAVEEDARRFVQGVEEGAILRRRVGGPAEKQTPQGVALQADGVDARRQAAREGRLAAAGQANHEHEYGRRSLGG